MTKADQWVDDMQQEMDKLRQRAEQAEREREETLRMWREYKTAKDADVASADAARERAEADNAALLRRLRGVALNVRLMRDSGAIVAQGWGKTLAPFVEGVDDADHPGAAMLERMRALEALADAVRTYIDPGPNRDHDLLPVRNALAAVDALKVPRG